jgi:hypothetical protein
MLAGQPLAARGAVDGKRINTKVASGASSGNLGRCRGQPYATGLTIYPGRLNGGSASLALAEFAGHARTDGKRLPAPFAIAEVFGILYVAVLTEHAVFICLSGFRLSQFRLSAN